MELHKDEVLYQELVPAAASEFGIPESYVEKDYFVVKLQFSMGVLDGVVEVVSMPDSYKTSSSVFS